MPTNTANLLIGPATISVGDWVTAGGAGTLTDVGHTKGGTKLAPQFNDVDIDSDQSFGALRKFPASGSFSIKIPMEEITLENLRRAMRQPSANVTGAAPNQTLLLGAPAEQYLQVQMVGPGLGTNKVRTATLWRCIVSEVAELGINKEGAQLLDVTLMVLYDDSVATADKFGTIVDS